MWDFYEKEMELGRSEERCSIIYYCLIVVKVRFLWMFVGSIFRVPYFPISIFLFDCISIACSLFPFRFFPIVCERVNSHIPQFTSVFIVLSNRLTRKHSTPLFRIILNVVK